MIDCLWITHTQTAANIPPEMLARVPTNILRLTGAETNSPIPKVEKNGLVDSMRDIAPNKTVREAMTSTTDVDITILFTYLWQHTKESITNILSLMSGLIPSHNPIWLYNYNEGRTLYFPRIQGRL
jgi:hypothetical protein